MLQGFARAESKRQAYRILLLDRFMQRHDIGVLQFGRSNCLPKKLATELLVGQGANEGHFERDLSPQQLIFCKVNDTKASTPQGAENPKLSNPLRPNTLARVFVALPFEFHAHRGASGHCLPRFHHGLTNRYGLRVGTMTSIRLIHLRPQHGMMQHSYSI
jgi:hypothetical protein